MGHPGAGEQRVPIPETAVGRPILVTGATGRIGRRVVAQLREAGQNVRVLVRPTAVIPSGWEGVERVVGDLDDHAGVAAAVAGAASVFLLSPMAPWLDRFESVAIDEAARARVAHLVKLSTTAPSPISPISWWRAHWRAEQRLRASGIPWTILRPNGIAMFVLEFAAEVRSDAGFGTMARRGRMALVDPDDVAAVAARVLLEGPANAGITLDLTGPAPLSYDDVAGVLGDLLGHTVAHRDLTAAEARTLLDGRGLSRWEVEGVLANWRMTRDGEGGFAAVTGDVARVLARPPRPLADFLAEHLDLFRRAIPA